jgi:SpoIID/LytB domain protein
MIGVGAIVMLLLSMLVVTPAPASAQSEEGVLVTVDGRGWGHGRGMGQWGAQGYALGVDGQSPWGSAQILDHYYPNTTASQWADATLRFGVNPATLRVEIRSSAASSSNTAQIGTPLRFDLESGTVQMLDANGVVDVPDIPEGMAGRISSTAGGMELRIKAGCDGDWGGPDVTLHSLPGVYAVDAKPVSEATGSQGLMRVCHNDGTSTWYEGWLRGANVDGSTRTVNVVSIEEYLRGVVPREVPAWWEPAALEAQAVAARSYALSGDPRYGDGGFADTCDTTRCQVYGGRYRQTSSGFEPTFDSATDAAIAATEGLVRVFGDNSVARTEFSSSTGGYTLDASDLGGFPAVEDLGDSTAANPNRTWSVTLDLTSWVAEQGKGRLLGIDEVERTGNGPDGGHVLQVDFFFEEGIVSMSGDEARSRWRGSPVSSRPGQPTGLLSTWFTFDNAGLDLVGENGAYVDAVYQLFLQRGPNTSERSAAVAELIDGGSRYGLTSSLALSPEWAGVEIDDLYPIVFSRPADDQGRTFWLEQMTLGRRFQGVAAEFYGSPEFFTKVGETNEEFVRALYEEIQGRDADEGGLRFWTEQLDSGQMSRTKVAAGFYGSPESREGRVEDMYEQVLGRGPDAGGLEFWAEQLLTRDDVALAAELAASDEFFGLAQG